MNNHGFCVFLNNNVPVLMQVFLGHSVRLIRRLARANFLISMGKLRSGKTAEAYDQLFRVTIEKFAIETFYTTRIDG